ncbi:diguanylate cyclase [Ammoniphilus sp. CFH 90114]|uniref:sensor domain-containing diguanylate cyclase n=1 Tax=Ammoniphilus sp. CFH 90114 TaxID=2493665 RepID=UPI00100EF42B|nr:diguanylate cyclase [Ammoniphilus sp. CFH 90114]RXT03829.1 sensor domain-containing diguanylate cyclase [Ammoniphilus sp. CFH 90114]
MNIKLRTYVAALFAVVIFALTTVLSFSIGKQSSEKVKREIGNTLSATAYQMADKLDFFMWSRAGEIDVLSQLKDIKDPSDIQTVQELLDQLQESFPVFSWVGFTDVNGKVLAATGQILEGADISKRPVFQEGIKGRFIGDVHEAVLLAKLLPNPSGGPLEFVDISKVVVGENGKLVGVLAAHLSWEWSRQVQKDILKPLRDEMVHAEIFVVSKRDNTIILGPENMIGKPLHLDSVQLAQKGQNHWLLETWPDGKKYLTGFAFGGGYQNYPGLGWSTVVRIPEETAFLPVKELQEFILLIGVVCSLLFAFIGWYVAGFITKPLQHITHTANRLRAGEKVEIPYYRGIKDIEILSLSLRELVDSLVRTVSDLGRMENLAHHDNLTGLPNRIALDAFLDESMKKAEGQGQTLSFLYLDLDGFKQVNDTYGHHTGDILLQEVAKRLKGCIRGDEGVFRLGGDEFLVVIFTATDHHVEGATIVAEKMITSLNQPFYLGEKRIQVGCSIGGSVWPHDDREPIAVVRYADEALYTSKRTGKNKVTFH